MDILSIFVTFISATLGVLTFHLLQTYACPYFRRNRTWNYRNAFPFSRPVVSDFNKNCLSLNGMRGGSVNSDDPIPLTFNQEVEAFEKSTGTRLLFLYHAEGGPFSSPSLGTSDANSFVTSLRKLDPLADLTVILNTPGGSVNAAEIIINALRNHKGRINIYVPFYACSSGTMIALAGTKLHIGQNAHLGPFDPSLGILGIGAKDILSALPKEGTEGSFLTPVYRGMRTSATRAMKRIYSNLTDRIVQGKFSDEQVDRIKAQMIDGDISHDTPFFYSDLSYLGDYISCSIPENVYTIYDKFLEHGAPRKNSNPLLSALGM